MLEQFIAREWDAAGVDVLQTLLILPAPAWGVVILHSCNGLSIYLSSALLASGKR